MLSDRSEEPTDSRILEHFTDGRFGSLKAFNNIANDFASHKPTHPWLSEDDKGLLTNLGVGDDAEKLANGFNCGRNANVWHGRNSS